MDVIITEMVFQTIAWSCKVRCNYLVSTWPEGVKSFRRKCRRLILTAFQWLPSEKSNITFFSKAILRMCYQDPGCLFLSFPLPSYNKAHDQEKTKNGFPPPDFFFFFFDWTSLCSRYPYKLSLIWVPVAVLEPHVPSTNFHTYKKDPS